MVTDTSKKYQTALVCSGGGSRFGYYMGMYAALCKLGKQPDVILASCGGAYVSGLISLCSDPKIAQQMMVSRTFYQMLCQLKPIKPTPHNKFVLLKSAIWRWLHCQQAKQLSKQNNATPANRTLTPLSWTLIDNLHNQALYQIINENEANPLWQSSSFLQEQNLPTTHLSNNPLKNKISTIVVACRSQPFENGFVWQQLLRSDNVELTRRLNQLQEQGKLTANISNYSPHILPELHIAGCDDMPIDIAVRASMNDMFYLPPIRHQGNMLLGGVIDLLPIEIACQLADTVYAEYKLPFDKWIAEPAIHSVFGFFANNRRKDWHGFQSKLRQIHWVDTTDNRKQLPPVLIRKPKPLQGYIDIETPSYEAFVHIMQAQYQYGYKQIMQTQHGLSR